MKRRLSEASLLCPRFAFVDQQTFAKKSALCAYRSVLDELEAFPNEYFLDYRRIAQQDRARATESERADRTMLTRSACQKLERILCKVRKVSSYRTAAGP